MLHKVIVLDVSAHNRVLAETLNGLARMITEAEQHAVRFTIVTFGLDNNSPSIECACAPASQVKISAIAVGGNIGNMYDAITKAYEIVNAYLLETVEEVTGVEMSVLSSRCNLGSKEQQSDITRIYANCQETGWDITMRGLEFPKMACIGHKLGLDDAKTTNLAGKKLPQLLDKALKDTISVAPRLKSKQKVDK